MKLLKRKLSNILSTLRSKPQYFIIGAQKGGTSSLYGLLNQHPDCASAKSKEVHYYDLNYQKGFSWYLNQFPFGKRITGEASPYYLFHPLVPARLKKDFPDAKLIVLLRHPVDRAYSHYHHIKKYQLESANTFEEAIENELKDITDYEAQFKAQPLQSIPQHQHRLYLARGLYIEQIKRWLEYFKKEQFLFLSSEVFFKNPQEIINQCFSFIGLEDGVRIENEILLPGDYFPMKNATRQQLLSYFEPYNEQLFELIGKEWQWSR